MNLWKIEKTFIYTALGACFLVATGMVGSVVLLGAYSIGIYSLFIIPFLLVSYFIGKWFLEWAVKK
jgi:Zn-dependent protease with chaperone function